MIDNVQRYIIACLLIVNPVIYSQLALAAMYKCINPDGRVMYSDKECPESAVTKTELQTGAGSKIITKPVTGSNTQPKTQPVDNNKAANVTRGGRLVGNWNCKDTMLGIRQTYHIKQDELRRTGHIFGIKIEEGGSWRREEGYLLFFRKWEIDKVGKRNNAAHTFRLKIVELTQKKLHLQNKSATDEIVNVHCTR